MSHRFKPWRLAVCLQALSCLSGASLAQELPAGWAARSYEGGVLYEATGLQSSAALNLWVPPASRVGGADAMHAFDHIKREGLRGLDVNGTTPHCKDAQLSAQGGVTQICRIDGGNKVPLDLEFVMLPLHGGQASWLRVVSTGDATALAPLKGSFATVLALAMQRVAANSGQANVAPRAAVQAQGSGSGQAASGGERQAAQQPPSIMAPGAGLKPNEYEAVLFSWKQGYYATGIQYEETIYLLFKDGTAYEGLELAPQDFNVAAAHQLRPKRWVRWRKSGKTYEILRPNATAWTALKAWPATPGRPDERPGKTFTNYWYSGSIGLGGAASKRSYTLKADGRFEQFGQMSIGTGSMQAMNGFSSSSVSTYDRSGTKTAGGVSATGGTQFDPQIAGGGSSRQRNDGSSHTGSYRIDGWSIEFHRDDGSVDRHLFLFDSEQRKSINIGGVDYSQPSKS